MSAVALMLGNVVVGIAVLAPAGMLPDLAAGLEVSIREAGLLIAYGAVILCFGSPLMAWATTRVDRRTLLAATLALLAIGQLGSAFAPNYLAVLVLRLLMLAVAAIYTPQAASTIAMIVTGKGARQRNFLRFSRLVVVGCGRVAGGDVSLGALWLARHLWGARRDGGRGVCAQSCRIAKRAARCTTLARELDGDCT